MQKQRNGRSFIGVDIKIAAHQDLYILPTEGTGEASPSLFMLLQEPGMGWWDRWNSLGTCLKSSPNAKKQGNILEDSIKLADASF